MRKINKLFAVLAITAVTILNLILPKAVSADINGSVTPSCTTEQILFLIELFPTGTDIFANEVWVVGQEIGGGNQEISEIIPGTPTFSNEPISHSLFLNPSNYNVGDTVTLQLVVRQYAGGGDEDIFINGEFSCTVQPTSTPIPTGTIPPQIPPPGPIPEPYVPCGETRGGFLGEDSEFHTLRPYQVSPCNQTLSDLKLYCGNDLFTVDEIEVSYADAIPGSCIEISDDPPVYDCAFSEERQFDVSVDLSDAELPVAGNTQLVPNQVNGGGPSPERFKEERLVNEYLSWYFNGTTYRGDVDLYDINTDMTVEPDVTKLVAFSGPLKKLLSQEVQQIRRSWTIGNIPSHGGNPPRHDQIVYCTFGGNQVACRNGYRINVGTDNVPIWLPVNVHRLSDGNHMTESPYTPVSSTEDRLGEVVANVDTTVQPNQPGGVTVSDLTINYTEDTESTDVKDRDLLFFPHMQEDADLAHLFQQTYLPFGSGGASFTPNEEFISYNTYRCALEDVRWNTGDDLYGEYQGDAGVLENAAEQGHGEGNITGTVSYTADFRCNVSPGGYNEQCWEDTYALCINNQGGYFCDDDNPPPPYPNCASYCTQVANNNCRRDGNTCTKEAWTASSIYTRSPKAEEIWQRTVAGPESIVKRTFPQIGINGMFDEIKDYPLVTTAHYSASSGDVDVYGGDYDGYDGAPYYKPGDRAEIYIPHLGGVYEFFLIAFQDLLRPQVMNSRYLRNGLPPGSGDPGLGTGNCSLAPDGSLCSVENLYQFFTGSPEHRLIAASYASAICWRESRAYPGSVNRSCTYSTDGIDNDEDGCVDWDDAPGNYNSRGEACRPCTIAGTQYWYDCATVDYSIGLFQHNALALCGIPYIWYNQPGGPSCDVSNLSQTQLDCIDNLMDATGNIQLMVERSNNGTNFGPWCTHNPAYDCGAPGC